jgi:hypothetical protein
MVLCMQREQLYLAAARSYEAEQKHAAHGGSSGG